MDDPPPPWSVALDGATGALDLDPADLPLALWGLRRVLRVGATAQLQFRRCGPGLLGVLLEGAGFRPITIEPEPGTDRVAVTVRRERTLADTVAPNMRLLLVGLNPSLYAADVSVGFGRPGNRAWPALLEAGLATVDRDPLDLLVRHGVGMSDLVKRATAKASELTADEFRHGLDRLEGLCGLLRPGAVCVLGVTGWRTATGDRRAGLGHQDRSLGGRPVYVMPNPSGLNAHTNVADLVEHLHAALALADAAPVR